METSRQRPRNSLTLSQRFVLLAVACLLPFLGFALWAAWHERERELEKRVEGASAVARLAAAEITRALGHTRQLLVALSAAADRARPLEGLCEAVLQQAFARPSNYLQAVIAAPDGRIVCGVNPVPAGATIADRAYFRRAIAERVFAHSGLVTSRTTGRRTIAAGHPLLGPDGAVRGAIAVSIDLQWVQRLFEGVRPPADAVLSLVDGAGRIAVRHPPLPERIGEPVPEVAEFLKAASGRSEGVVEARGSDAIDRVVGFARVDGDGDSGSGEGAFVRVGISRASIEADARKVLASGIATFAVVLALAGTIAWFAAGRLVIRPVRALIDASRRMNLADPAYRTGLADERGEIGQLAGALDRMAARLQRSVRALRALSAGNRTILQRQGEQALLEAMCRVVVEVGNYPLAMVHYREEDEAKSLVLRAHAGHADYAAALRLTWADTELGQGPAGTAARTGRTDVVHDIAAEPRFAPWRELARSRGFSSVASLPLIVEGGVIGAFTFVAVEPDAFDADELALIDEIALDLAHGIETIRAREQLEAAQAAAAHAARHDAVSGLPNRAALVEAVAGLADRARERRESSALLVAYMPRMQDLLDVLGHDNSNRVIRVLSERLRRLDPAGASVARLSFDEFGMALGRRGAGEAEAVAARLRRIFEDPVAVEGAPIEVQACVGVAMIPEHGDEPDLVLRRASRAAREAARRDLACLVHAGAAENEGSARLAMVAELRRAIEHGELVLHYQPKMDLRHGGMGSVEALVRWMHPGKGMIPPGDFIPTAERTGLIRPMTYAILEMAARQQAEWIARGLQTPIAVNVAARSLVDPQFAPRFAGILERHGVPAGLIEIEITESSLVDDPKGAQVVLRELRQRGCRISIDDFGTGYSCLSYLVNLPVHALKIDRSFVLGMGGSREAYQVVASVVSMAKGLGLQVVAEGVETAPDVALLKGLGCDQAQGFHFCRPMPAAQLEALWESGDLARAGADTVH
ncbi:MAG: EAL domain-containing protein [Burkholderiales bacterium]